MLCGGRLLTEVSHSFNSKYATKKTPSKDVTKPSNKLLHRLCAEMNSSR